MGHGLEACEGVPPQKGVVSAIEWGHVEEQLFGPVILRCAVYYIKFDFPRALCFSTGDDASKGGTALLDAVLVHLHFVERVFIDEVKSATAIHEYFSEPKAVHDWAKDQSGWCPDGLESRFITALKVIGVSF